MNDAPWCSTPAITDSYTTSRRSSAFRLRGGRTLTWWTSGVESDLTSGLSGRASKSTQSRLTDLVARENGPRDDNLWHPRSVRESALETLQRWETAGGHWEVLSHSPAGLIVALLRCDGGEEVHRFTSPDPDLVAYIGDRETSEQ